jgi:hypothetical protein
LDNSSGPSAQKIAHRNVDRLRNSIARAGNSKCTRVTAHTQEIFWLDVVLLFMVTPQQQPIAFIKEI